MSLIAVSPLNGVCFKSIMEDCYMLGGFLAELTSF